MAPLASTSAEHLSPLAIGRESPIFTSGWRGLSTGTRFLLCSIDLRRDHQCRDLSGLTCLPALAVSP
jgi:hypothetical protein